MNAKGTLSGSLQMFFPKVDTEAVNSAQGDKEPLRGDPKTNESASSCIQVLKNSVLDAEIKWVLKCIHSHFSFNSCTDINDVFRDMFPDSEIAKQFSCGPTKCAYIACFGLAPYYSSLLYTTLNNAECFTLFFDESLNKSLQSKQMDIHIRFWDNTTDRIVTRYLTSVFMGHSTAEDTLKAFQNATNKLDLSKLIQLSMDGPAVNWKFFHIVQKQIKDEFDKQLLNLGSCGLHVLNNAFKKGNRVSKWNLDSLFTALYWLFKDSPSRREDFLKVSLTKKLPYKFCSHRWLENILVAERTLEIWDDIKKFVKCTENKEFPKPGSKSYETVEKAAKDNMICIKLNFFLSVAKIVTPFLTHYQSSNPMLPFFAEDLRQLILDVIVNFNIIKKESTDKLNSANKVSKFDFGDKSLHAPIQKISLGFIGNRVVKNLLFEKKILEKEVFDLKLEARDFVIAMLEKILEKSPINSLMVRSLSCLDPRQMAFNNFECYTKMKTVLSGLVKVNAINETECEEVLIEYNKFLNEKVSPNSHIFNAFKHTEDRLDCFLIKYFEPNYCKLYTIIKKLLILSHGQADVERGFSTNKLIEIENMKEETFVAQRVIIDHNKNESHLTKVPISKDLRLSVANARQKYVAHLEEQRKRKVTEVQQKKRKLFLDDLDELKNKKTRLEDAVCELENNADKLAEKAESSGDFKYIFQSNSFRRSAKEKKEELKEIDLKIECVVKNLKD